MKPADAAALVVLSILWGSAFLFIDVALDEFDPATIVAVRLAIAAIVLTALLLATGRRLPGRSRWGVLLLLGVLSNVVPFSLITSAQQHIASSLTATLNSTMPLMTFVIAAAAGDEQPNRTRLLGLVVGFVGAAVLIGPDLTDITNANTLAQLAVLAGTASYAIAGVIARRTLRGDAVALATGQLACGALVAIPLALVVDGPVSVDVSVKAALAVVALGVTATGFAYVIFFTLIQRLPATDVAAVTYLIPIVATLLGWLVLDETIGGSLFVGLALIIAGMAIINGALSSVARRLRASPTPARS